jgi:hypothetical protein
MNLNHLRLQEVVLLQERCQYRFTRRRLFEGLLLITSSALRFKEFTSAQQQASPATAVATVGARDEYQLVYNRLKLKNTERDIQIRENTQDQHNTSWAIRIPTADVGGEGGGGRRGGTNLDFIFTGPNSAAVC